MLGSFATASRFTLPFTTCRYCRTSPAHRCRRRRRQQRQRVTEGTAMAPWNWPNYRQYGTNYDMKVGVSRWVVHFKQQEAFEKCWTHSPLRAATLPFTTVSLLSHAATVALRLRIDVHNDDDDNNDNAWQRGPLWPHRMGPITLFGLHDIIIVCCTRLHV